MGADVPPLNPIVLPKLPATEFVAKVTFGPDLVLLASIDGTAQDTSVKLETPWLTCHMTGRKSLDRMSTLTIKDAIAPKAVMDEIMKRYGTCHDAANHAPVTLYINDTKVATLTFALIQQIGYSCQAQEFSAVGGMQVVGIWQELSDAVDAFNAAQAKEQAELDALKPKPTQAELDAEAARVEQEYAYRDSEAYYFDADES
jgi:hypothetical protein